jgi:hypothetical protein
MDSLLFATALLPGNFVVENLKEILTIFLKEN